MYCDMLNNPKSTYTQSERETLMRNAPEFTNYGKRFAEANESWLLIRNEAYGGEK